MLGWWVLRQNWEKIFYLVCKAGEVVYRVIVALKR